MPTCGYYMLGLQNCLAQIGAGSAVLFRYGAVHDPTGAVDAFAGMVMVADAGFLHVYFRSMLVR